MNSAQLYVIDYTLHGVPKSFIIRLTRMDNAIAWHWAGCDAGVVRIGRPGRENEHKSSRLDVAKHGVADVKWRAT